MVDLAKTLRADAEALLARYANLAALPAAFISLLCPVAVQKAARNIP